jgi:hypothetical protein
VSAPDVHAPDRQVVSTVIGHFRKRAKRRPRPTSRQGLELQGLLPRWAALFRGCAALAAAGGGRKSGRPHSAGRRVERNRGVASARAAAAAVGTATVVGILISITLGCAPGLQAPLVLDAEPASSEESYCAWYGDERDGVLYFGAAPFWSTARAQGGNPRADLERPGPQLVGRFDLRERRFLPPLDLSPVGSQAGIWDVLAHPNGRVYFTDYFGRAGYVEPADGRVERFDALGPGLNELALGPGGTLLATRYGSEGEDAGSVVRLDADGALVAEYPVRGPDGYRAAPKSLAYDPVRGEIWLNTDLVPEGAGPGAGVRYDARVLGPDGSERLRFERPELQFMAFGEDGTGWFAEVDGARLTLRIRPPDRAASPVMTGRLVPLDDAFPLGLDFVQDIQVAGDVAVVTRWGGRVHVVDRDGTVRDLALPRQGDELYYTGVLEDGTVCATRCGELTVVCAPVP